MYISTNRLNDNYRDAWNDTKSYTAADSIGNYAGGCFTPLKDHPILHRWILAGGGRVNLLVIRVQAFVAPVANTYPALRLRASHRLH